MFAIVNPIGNVPLFLQATTGMKPALRNKIYDLAIIIAAILIFVFSFTGEYMLRSVFRININEMKIMGGLVLIVLAIRSIVFPKPFEKIKNVSLDIAAVPLAFPFLVAAVSFVTGMLIVKERGYIGGSLVFFSVFFVSWIIIRFGSEILKLTGESVMSVFSKIMYIILAAKAIKLLMSVIPQYFHH